MDAQNTVGLRQADQPLAELFDVALLDLDGVVYLGHEAVDGAPGALASIRERGMRLAFVTNNAARPATVVAQHLTDLGIPTDPSDVTTSAQAAARYLADRLPPGAHVLVVGAVGLVEALAERGLLPVDKAGDQVAAVVQGYSPRLNWPQLAEGAVAIATGVPWVATNVDPTVPSPRGPLPGNGSMVAALRHATGAVPIVTGKPDPAMHRESVLRSGAKRPIVVGDRLDTDIEGANSAGCPSMLVFSGVSCPHELLRAAPALRPHYVGRDVGALLVRHPAPMVAGRSVTCGRWRAFRNHGAIGLTSVAGSVRHDGPGYVSGGAADGLDAVRALAVASWAAQDAGYGTVTVSGTGSAAVAALREWGLA
jgi:glycerol-1-phosphatase